MTRIFFNLFRLFDKFNFMNFKNVSPKEFLELGLPKTAFRILGLKCVGSALGTRLGFVRGETIVTVVRM